MNTVRQRGMEYFAMTAVVLEPLCKILPEFGTWGYIGPPINRYNKPFHSHAGAGRKTVTYPVNYL
jgi:hypothetical protein